MKIISFIFFSFLATTSYAQSLRVATTHFDREGKQLKDEVGSYYYGIDSTFGLAERSDGFYTATNKPRYTIEPGYRDQPRKFTTYYEEGGIMAIGMSVGNKPMGLVKVNYSDGKPQAQLNFTDVNEKTVITVEQYWDENGNKIVHDGNGSGTFFFPAYVEGGEGAYASGKRNGIWKISSSGRMYEETYDHGTLLKGTTTKEGVSYQYAAVEEQPSYKKSPADLDRYIRKSFRPPSSTWNKPVHDSIFVEFFVEPDGSVDKVKVVKGLQDDCDEEMLRVIKASGKWNPGRTRGVPVAMRVVLPVKF